MNERKCPAYRHPFRVLWVRFIKRRPHWQYWGHVWVATPMGVLTGDPCYCGLRAAPYSAAPLTGNPHDFPLSNK